MLDLNPNLFPPGGFYYHESDGIDIRANSLELLTIAVRDYRSNAKLPAGDPRRDIAIQICGRSPQVCQEVSVIPTGPSAGQKALLVRVVKSTNELKKTESKLKFVDSNEAYLRASVCKACPHKRDWASHCPPCKANALEILKDIIKPRELIPSVTGCACDLAGDDLSAAVWVETGLRLNTAPADCWRAKYEDS